MNKETILMPLEPTLTKEFIKTTRKSKRKFKDFAYKPFKCTNCGRDVKPNDFWVHKEKDKEFVYCDCCMAEIWCNDV